MNLATNQDEDRTNISIKIMKNHMQENLFGQDGPSLDQAQNNQQFQNAFNNALDETNPELRSMLKNAEKKGFQKANKENEMAQLIKSIRDEDNKSE